MAREKLLIIIFILVSTLAYPQKINNTAVFREIENESYFRLNYDNDFFSANDYYYTQGYNLELVAPKLKYNPLNRVLLHLTDSLRSHSLSFEHFGFTATSIQSDEILVDDRPFSAVMLIKSSMVSTARARKMRLASTISVGIIGPSTRGGEMQETIHRWIGGVIPKGWQHQIQNDFVINYEVDISKQAFTSKFLHLDYNSALRIGTLNTRVQSGLTFVLGRYYNTLTAGNRKTQLYLFSQPLMNVVIHDATLQGTFFNESPHTIKASHINRFQLQNNFGAILKTKRMFLEYYQTLLSKEFQKGRTHRWGGFKIGFGL
jgi:hypothetical protein